MRWPYVVDGMIQSKNYYNLHTIQELSNSNTTESVTVILTVSASGGYYCTVGSLCKVFSVVKVSSVPTCYRQNVALITMYSQTLRFPLSLCAIDRMSF